METEGSVSTRLTGLGELSVVQGCDDVLVAQGLGSCIGIAAFEPRAKVAVLAHVMLPGPAPDTVNPEQPARYAAHAVAAVLKEVEARGGSRRNLVIKLAGGAQVITTPGMADRLMIGLRNAAAVRELLAEHNLRIAAEDTGGHSGRTLSLHAGTGQTTVRVAGGAEQPL